MRWFIVLLLLANLALYFWLQHDSLPEESVDALPPPDIGRLELLPSDGFGLTDPPSAPPVKGTPVGEAAPAIDLDDRPVAAASADRGEAVTAVAPTVPDGIGPSVELAALAESMSQMPALEDGANTEVPAPAPGLGMASHVAGGQPGAAQPIDDSLTETLSPAMASPPMEAQLPEQVPEQTPELVPEPESSSEPPVEPPAEPEPDPVVALCAQVGPLTPEQADTLIQRLPVFVILLSDVAEEVRTVDAYYVMVPPLGSRPEGLRMLEALEQAGITDTWLFPRGQYRNAISLGLFNRQSGAVRWQREVIDRGFDAEVVERATTSEHRRLLLKNVDGGDIALSLPLPEGVTAEDQPCP